MTAAVAMVAIDALAVLVALPTIQRDLDASPIELQWIVNAFLLPYAGLLVLGGRAGDALGRIRTFRIGVVLFLAASVASGLAGSVGWLIAARAAQGVAAAILRPSADGIAVSQFGRQERGRAEGISTSVATFFYGVAPLVGGVLTATVSWRAIFFLNLPLGVTCLALVRVLLPRVKPKRSPVDWGSAPLLVGGLGCVVLALMESRDWGWASRAVIGLLAGGFLLLAVMVIRELRLAEPLIQVRLFALRSFSVDSGVLAAVRFSFIGFSVFGVIWVQDVLGFSAVQAGLFMLPLTFPTILCAPLGGILYDRLGPRVPVVMGGTLLAGGMLGAAVTLHQQTYFWLLPFWIAVGVGVGTIGVPAFSDAFNSTPHQLRSQTAGALQTTREIGATLGLAVMGMTVTHVQGARLSAVLRHDGRVPVSSLPVVERSIGKAVAAQNRTTLPAGIPADLVPALKQTVTQAVSAAFYLAFAVMVVALSAAAVLLSRQPPGASVQHSAAEPPS
ncbi:MFS transporter (plasmid) [Streptomyces sp. CA-142005]|uniref:MFS transporter n=1 Tax=Streptomyces sp. CA-142005 TaxID=3240052 RepID=UPI003D8F4489